MPKAIWNGAVLAEAIKLKWWKATITDTINKGSSQVRLTTCPWKGLASYHIEVDGQVNKDAAYPTAKEKAKTLRVMWRFGEG